jgi:hypothetical protein
MNITGKRTLLFSLYAATILLAGFALVEPGGRAPAFTFFAGALVGIVGAVATKSAVGVLAGGGGIEGAKAALMTAEKPEPSPPAAP